MRSAFYRKEHTGAMRHQQAGDSTKGRVLSRGMHGAMATPSIRIRLVLYAPHGEGAVSALEMMRAGLPAGEVTPAVPVELEGPKAKTFDYNSKMQLKGQTLEWTLTACDGQVQTPAARQTLLKGVHGVLLWANAAADVSNLESALVGDFDQVSGKTYALVVVAADAGSAKDHQQLLPSVEAPQLLKELMKAALKVAAASM